MGWHSVSWDQALPSTGLFMAETHLPTPIAALQQMHLMMLVHTSAFLPDIFLKWHYELIRLTNMDQHQTAERGRILKGLWRDSIPCDQPGLVARRAVDSLKFQQENCSNSRMLLACQTWCFLKEPRA